MENSIAMAFPVIPGKEASCNEWYDKLNRQYLDAYTAKQAEYGVREKIFIQKSPDGWLVIDILEGRDIDGYMEDVCSDWATQTEVGKYVSDMMEDLHGFRLESAEIGEMPGLVLDTGRKTATN